MSERFCKDLYTVCIKHFFLKKFWNPPRSAVEIPLHEKLTSILCYFPKESLMPIEKKLQKSISSNLDFVPFLFN